MEAKDQPPSDSPPERPPASPGFGAADRSPERTDVHGLHAAIVRERSEPKDGYEPVPLWLVGLSGALLFWGGWYLATYSGGFRSDVLDPDPAARFGGTGAQGPKEINLVALGEKVFKANCVSCHQAGGQGVPGQYPPLNRSEWVLGPPYRMKRIPLNGLAGPVTVRGQTYNGNMPIFGNRLNDENLAAVLTYVRQAWDNDAGPISPESVAATRKAVGNRTTPWSEAELLAITEPDFKPTAKPTTTQAATSRETAATQPASESTTRPAPEPNRSTEGSARQKNAEQK